MPETFVCHHRGLEAYVSYARLQPARDFLTRCFVFVGPPGCGKSRLVREYLPDDTTTYYKPEGGWFDGYMGQGPSNKWWLSFKKRHGVALRKPDPLDRGRRDAIDEEVISNFFDMYQSELTENGLQKAPHRIYNCDETGFTSDPQKKKIITFKSLGGYASSVRPGSRDHITAMECASADGNAIPPLPIFSKSFPSTAYTFNFRSSHFLQPMDARGGPFSALKTKFAEVVQNICLAKPNFYPSKSTFPRIYNTVRDQALTTAVVKRGFRKTGIFPENPNSIDKTWVQMNNNGGQALADVMAELGEDAQLGHVSTVVAKMWKKLPADRRKDWKEKAQRTREDMDTDLVEKKRCDRCNTSFTRDKDLKYHQKGSCMKPLKDNHSKFLRNGHVPTTSSPAAVLANSRWARFQCSWFGRRNTAAPACSAKTSDAKILSPDAFVYNLELADPKKYNDLTTEEFLLGSTGLLQHPGLPAWELKGRLALLQYVCD
ncbi:hypothetical protein Bbelb_343430 [Branchiostoma belcheri]|nr:hypothetical protein Bbelb_343430 [Branchiostoma belcheri]